MPKLRDNLPPLTERLKKLPIDERGYPIPRFVQWIKLEQGKPIPCPEGEGEPDFRITSMDWLMRCIMENVCWICGDKLGVFRAYNIGPLDAITRNSAEPPSHLECAEWAVKACPFMLNPNSKMREDKVSTSKTVVVNPAMVTENPGIFAIWIVKDQVHGFLREGQGFVFKLPPPIGISWWKEGRGATSQEVMDAINRNIDRMGATRVPEQIALLRSIHELFKFIKKIEKQEGGKDERLSNQSRSD